MYCGARLAENAVIAAAKARPQRSAATGATTASGEANAPPRPATSANTETAIAMRAPAQASTPANSSDTCTGVETTAW